LKNGLEISNLHIWDDATGQVIVSDVSFHLKEGSCLAIVGKSGSGKSMTCKSIMRLHNAGIRQTGDILFRGENIGLLPPKAMRKLRGKHLYMIMQNGMRAFDPSRVVGSHLMETIAEHFDWSHSDIISKIIAAMESVMLRNPAEVLGRYPHQLSGGMLQRLMIALALVLEPDLIIADEPTTALDTVSQFEVVEQLRRLKERKGCSMLFISHDMGVVKNIADEILVMKDGSIVESGLTSVIFTDPHHEYTRHLVSAKLSIHRHYQKMMGGGNIAER
jgi:nickel transport system ATP-binding protein